MKYHSVFKLLESHCSTVPSTNQEMANAPASYIHSYLANKLHDLLKNVHVGMAVNEGELENEEQKREVRYFVRNKY